MKRFLLLMLALTLLMPACLAESGALDAAFASGALNLVPIPFAPLEMAQSVSVPDGFIAFAGLEGVTADSLAANILAHKAEIRVLDISPDGNALIGELEGIPLAITGGAIHVLCPTPESIAADEFENLSYLKKATPDRWLGNEGIAWSPDGHYAVPLCWTMVILNMHMELDPMVIDTQTGDIRVLATYPSKPLKNGAAPSAAVFSEDGSTIFFMMYGTAFEGIGALLRADLETDWVQTCFLHVNFPDHWPQLGRLSGGRLVALSDESRTKAYQGVAVYEPIIDQFMRIPTFFKEPIANVFCRNLRVSDKTDRGIAYGHTGLYSLRFGAMVEGLDERWGLERESGALVKLPVGDETASDQRGQIDTPPVYADIVGAALSPDGNYALVVFASERGATTLLIRLEDMATVPVNGLEYFYMGNGGRLLWSEAGILSSVGDSATRLFGVR